MRSPIASEFRRLRRQMERANRRVALADIPGKVIPGSQVYDGDRTVRLDLGRSADGRVIKSPKVKWQQAGAGTLRVHTPPKDDEQMRLRSPSGTVGTGSLADWGTYDDDTRPPSESGDEAVIEFGGKARFTLREDRIVLSIGTSSVTLKEGEMTLVSDRIDLNP
tara:strand:- start:8400 stop:8891 length:492 start_codon:yes stop_codon:yes gene_type:complete